MNAKRDYSNNNYGELPFRPDALLLPFGRKSFLSAVVERYASEPIDMGPNTDREAFDLAVGGRRLTLIYSGMGSPVTANALEKAAANGVKRVVLFGACGGVATNVAVGDIVVPNETIRGECTSRYYADAKAPARPDADLHARLFAAAHRRSQATVHAGVVYTTDASYRQGPEVYDRTDQNVVAVDCECSAAFIVAAALGLRLASIFFCTDNVRRPDTADRRRRGLESTVIRRAFELVIDVAVELPSWS